MNLIFSESGDLFLKKVLEWLNTFGHSFERINYNFDSLCIGNVSMKYSNNFLLKNLTTPIFINDIDSVWYNRGLIQVPNLGISSYENLKTEFDLSSIKYSESYNESIREIILDKLNTKKWIGVYGKNRQNKIIALNIAANNNLEVPQWEVVSSKSDLLSFYETHEKIIVKSLDSTFTCIDQQRGGGIITSYTNFLQKKQILSLPKFFPPSLIQRYIDKKLEVRCFFLKGKCYSTAILSQRSQRTSVDYRKYDLKNMNRYIPFKLPIDIEKKITSLMNELNLETGSIDIIYSKDNKFYFLEVNPTGQFSGLASLCNYDLDKKIALELIK